MKTGMLWFDNDPKTALNVKVERAADYYRQKYGKTPNLCLVNPGMVGEVVENSQKVTIRPYRPVLPGHLWIGIEAADGGTDGEAEKRIGTDGGA